MIIEVSDWWPRAAASMRDIVSQLESSAITESEARERVFSILNELAALHHDTTGFLPSLCEQLAAVPRESLPRALRAAAGEVELRYIDIAERDAGAAGVVGLD